VTTMIKCANGESVLVTHDTNLPRPYSLGFTSMARGHLEPRRRPHLLRGKSPEAHVWKRTKPISSSTTTLSGRGLKARPKAPARRHGLFRAQRVCRVPEAKAAFPHRRGRRGRVEMHHPLSEQSIAEGGEPQQFPDFTGGLDPAAARFWTGGRVLTGFEFRVRRVGGER